jgi:hypothetical protein
VRRPSPVKPSAATPPATVARPPAPAPTDTSNLFDRRF